MKPEQAKEDQNTEIAQSEEEQAELDISIGEKDADVYSDEGMKDLEDSDALEPAEEGFMQGEIDEGKKAKCATCGKELLDVETAFEKEVDGKRQFFCSEECVENYKKKENIPEE